MIGKVGLIGYGRLGHALGKSLGSRLAFVVDPRMILNQPQSFQFASRLTDIHLSVDLVIIAVPDGQITAVIDELIGHTPLSAALWVHTSGTANMSPFDHLSGKNGVGMMHPLYSFDDDSEWIPEGLLWGCNGDDIGMGAVNEVVQLMKGRSVVIPREKSALYHTLAVFVSNFPMVLAHIAETMLQQDDQLDFSRLRDGYMQLMAGAVSRLNKKQASEALTGPVMRGDHQTLRAHLVTLSKSGKGNAEHLYRELSRYILRNMCTGLDDDLRRGCEQALEENAPFDI